MHAVTQIIPYIYISRFLITFYWFRLVFPVIVTIKIVFSDMTPWHFEDVQKCTASRFKREQFSCFYSVPYNFLHPVPPSWRHQPIWICPSAHARWTPTLHRIPPNPQNECLFYFTSLFKQRRLNSFAKEGSNFTGMFFILSERSFVKSFQYSDWSRGGGKT